MFATFLLVAAFNGLDRFIAALKDDELNVTHILAILNVTDIHQLQDTL